MTDWVRVMQMEDEPAEAFKDDEQLVKRALRDTEAFAMLYRRHVERVYRYLLYRVGNIQDAEDLTSETFVEVMHGLKRYRAKGRFAAWVMGIARYNAIDHFRRQRPLVALELVNTMDESGIQPDEAVDHHLTLENVRVALEKLNPDRAEAIRLRMLGELSAAEIGVLMEKNEAAVRMLIYRGIIDLQQLLKEDSKS